MGAKCTKCHRDVGCGCNLIAGLCSSCSGTNFIATKEAGTARMAVQKETCEITLKHLNMLYTKLTCAVDRRKHTEINETLQNILNIRSLVNSTKNLADYCVNRPFIQLADQIVSKLNNLTDC